MLNEEWETKKSENNRYREGWVDAVKVFACFLVVLGHFFQSMTKIQIIQGTFWDYFDTTIYYFHVPLFFICSGYLYQRYGKMKTDVLRRKNILMKAITLGIPYITFSTITWGLQTLFSEAINNQTNSLFKTLLIQPISPYWYLYALFFIFLLTPVFSNKQNAVCGVIIAFCLKIVGGGY